MGGLFFAFFRNYISDFFIVKIVVICKTERKIENKKRIPSENRQASSGIIDSTGVSTIVLVLNKLRRQYIRVYHDI